jgi:hypothetical protein
MSSSDRPSALLSGSPETRKYFSLRIGIISQSSKLKTFIFHFTSCFEDV